MAKNSGRMPTVVLTKKPSSWQIYERKKLMLFEGLIIDGYQRPGSNDQGTRVRFDEALEIGFRRLIAEQERVLADKNDTLTAMIDASKAQADINEHILHMLEETLKIKQYTLDLKPLNSQKHY